MVKYEDSMQTLFNILLNIDFQINSFLCLT